MCPYYEVKFTFSLPDIEVKSADHATKNVHQKIKEAANQTKRRNELLGKLHADILLSDWTYVRALALPMLSSWETWEKEKSPQLLICRNCRNFILDQARLNDLAGWLNWLMNQRPHNFPVNTQYSNLLTRIIGFLLISDCEPPISKIHKLHREKRMQQIRKLNDEAVVGKKTVGEGVTSEQPQRDDISIFEEIVFEKKNSAMAMPYQNSNNNVSLDKKKRNEKPSHLGSLRTVVLWNKAQVSTLLSGRKKVILDADFGCGKTLLLKSCALHLQNSLREQCSQYDPFNECADIVFVSLSSARTQV